jgi:hypothetical protein
VFVLLVTEMVLFVALIIPMPFKVKRKMFNFISESPIVAKLQYGMKVRGENPSQGRVIQLTLCRSRSSSFLFCSLTASTESIVSKSRCPL